jgi:PA14 domain
VPNLEPVTLAGEEYAVRLVGPRAAVFPTSPAANVAVLGRADMVARPVVSASVPSSPDLVSGSYTLRLGDAGECVLTFPNSSASDGVPWRQRFDPGGHNQFLEIWRNGLLEQVCVIDTVQASQQQITVHGQDGWFLLKKAYERDWVVVQSPRDVIERATQVWVPTTTDNFPAGALNAQWTASTNNGGTVAIGQSGGLVLKAPAGSSVFAQVASPNVTVPSTATWRASCNVQFANINSTGSFVLQISEVGGSTWALFLNAGNAVFQGFGQVQVPAAASYGLALESDGEWVWAFANGMLVGCVRRNQTETALNTELILNGTAASACSAIVTGVLVEILQPFLVPGSDKGDFVLPGTASTYPSGGLHARYYNDTDLAGAGANRLLTILNPTRSQAYAGSGTAEYANQQDATINHANSATGFAPTPGAANTNFSVKWFGAIYLKLSQGNYTISFTVDDGVRIWIGKTKWGDQIIDSWITQVATTYNATLTAASLAGTPPYGGAAVAKDGWYPIVIEYFQDGGNCAAQFSFTPPVSYTDPGGTALTGGVSVIVPATSLSPLGCADQRYQGVSHFDLAQQTITGFGYQASVEPQQLESGLFPGVLAPRIREGHDTDIILKPDLSIREDGEGLLNYSSTVDATDFCSSLQGNGAGFQNGTTGQLQAEVYDPATMLASLFDVQGWQDFSDASFISLLQGLLNSRLGLQLTPWQLLSADPTGSPRLAYTWPLPSNLAAMRWRPGDGLRIQARDINVVDTVPRQLLVIARSFTPNGKTGVTASFANRPRNPARMLKQLLYSASRQQRNYQKQLVTLNGIYVTGVIAPGATGGNSVVIPAATDTIVRARLRVSANSGPVAFNVLVNGVDQTTPLTGAATITTVPLNLDLGPVANPDANGQLYAAIKVPGGVGSTFSYQLLCDVLR